MITFTHLGGLVCRTSRAHPQWALGICFPASAVRLSPAVIRMIPCILFHCKADGLRSLCSCDAVRCPLLVPVRIGTGCPELLLCMWLLRSRLVCEVHVRHRMATDVTCAA